MEAREDALVALLLTDKTIEPVVLTRHREGIGRVMIPGSKGQTSKF